MADYLEPLPTCDKVLELFTPEKPAGITHGDIMRILNISHGTPEAGFLLAALDRLKDDGYLKLRGANNDHFQVGGNMFVFKTLGGYRGLVERENNSDATQSIIRESGLKTDENVRQTGVSVQKMNKLLRPATIAQILIAILTLAIAGLAALISWWNYDMQKTTTSGEETRLKQLEQKVRMLEQRQTKTQPQAEKIAAHTSDSTKK